ncbi:MAG: DUF4126 domain-containing protein [Microcoleaceae cyanobacterium]
MLTSLGNFTGLEVLLEILLAISLSAAVGFRVFIPPLVLSAAAVFGHLDYPTEFDWVESPEALSVLAVAAFLEISGYYIPWFDHLLDLVSTPTAVIAGVFIAAAVTPDVNPVAQWTLALVAGGGAAGLTKGLSNILRSGSTLASGGLTNPIFSTLEWMMAFGLSVLALFLPVLTGFVVSAILMYALYKVWQLFAGRQPTEAS